MRARTPACAFLTKKDTGLWFVSYKNIHALFFSNVTKIRLLSHKRVKQPTFTWCMFCLLKSRRAWLENVSWSYSKMRGILSVPKRSLTCLTLCSSMRHVANSLVNHQPATVLSHGWRSHFLDLVKNKNFSWASGRCSVTLFYILHSLFILWCDVCANTPSVPASQVQRGLILR